MNSTLQRTRRAAGPASAPLHGRPSIASSLPRLRRLPLRCHHHQHAGAANEVSPRLLQDSSRSCALGASSSDFQPGAKLLQQNSRRPLRGPQGAAGLALRTRDDRTADILSISGATAGVSLAPSRTRIAVDVDEVLGRFVHTLNEFCKDHYKMDYKVGDYWVYEFAKIWGCTTAHSNHVVHEFFKSQHFNDGIPVIPGALESLTRLSESYDLVVVTSRQHVIQDVTLEWLDRHFPSLFQEVYFGNHFALEGTSRKKSDICRTIGAKVLIDDNPSYAVECAAAGIHVLLYDWNDSYPWSKLPAEKLSPLISIVRNWDEVELAVEKLSPVLLTGA